MNSWTIYGKNGVAKAEVNELELHDEWMAECFLTVSVKSAEPIDFAVDDYIDYRGERYAIQYDPTLLKKSRRNTYGEGFSYDNIKFVNEAQAKIVRCDFNDIVLNDNELHYTSLPTFPFYCESVDDLLDRILANLEDLYPGEFTIIGLNTVRNKQRADITHNTRYIDEYKKWIDPTFTPNTEPYGKQGVAETVDNINCWNALAKVHEDFELNFIVRGYTIIVGTVGVFTANKFRYGKGNGLYEIERISDSEQQIVTRLRSYGASTNLPTRYYATLNTQVFGTVTQISANTNYASFLIDLAFSTKYFNYRSESYPGTNEFPNYIVRVKANNHTVKGYVTKDYTTGACSIYCESVNPQEDDRDEPDAAELEAFAQSLSVGTRVYFVNYMEKGAFDSAHTDYATENLPDNMAVSRLMLPGFPNQSLYDWAKAHRDEDTPYDDTKGICTINGFTAAFSKDKYRPYIDSPNAEDYGIRPASFYFDGSGDNEDIHPTIEGMTYNNQPIDVIYAADEVTDNGVYAEGKSPNPIFITLPVLGFELDQVWKDDASIEMKDGMCGGRSLKIVSKPLKLEGGYWKCKVERVKDDSLDLWFPYNDFQIHSGDHYVLVGIDMPDAYVTAASERLFYASLTALQENHAPRFTYQPRIDEVWMQRQHDKHLATPAITSLHDTLKSGDIFSFADTDMAIDANIIIDVLTIKENGNNGIPTYEVTLRDEKQVSPIQKIQNKVDILSSGGFSGYSGGGSLSGRQIQSLIENEGNSYFLSKLNDDEAAGVITFLKGLWVKAKELFGITAEGDARLRNADISGQTHIAEDLNVDGRVIANWMQSTEYTGDGMLDTGYKLWYEEGRAKLVIDDLVARGKFTVNELETRIWTYAGGNMVFSGAGSTLFFVEYLDADENTLGYTNINAPWLLAGRPLLSAMVAWSKRRTVQRQLTDAEKAQVVKFRCYEYSDDGTMQTRNWWHVNDLAMCETLNKVRDKSNSDGSYSGYASNTVYKRRVAGIGSKEIAALDDGRVYDYVDLWNIYNVQGQTYIDSQGHEATITDSVKGFLNTSPSGQTPSTDWPAAGDVIVQCGNPLDADRQAVVTIEVQGDLHGFKVYDTINDYSMANKQWVEIGYDQTTGKAKANIYGDFRFGCRETEEADGGSYIKYDRDQKKLDIKANVRFTSPTTQQETTLDNFASTVVGDINDLQSQIDGEIDTWFYDYMPVSAIDSKVPLINITIGEQTVHCLPYYDWYTADGGGTAEETDIERIKHLGDIFYDTSSGYAFRFTRNETTNAFEWTIIEDSAVIKALENAAKAQDTADHKRRVFVEQPAPIAPKTYVEYDIGDLWTNVTYPANYTGETDESQHQYKNEILRCISAKPVRNAQGEVTDGAFSINDWALSNGYTTKLNNFVTNTYAPFVTNIQGQVDQKAETWRQTTDPADSWTTDTEKAKHVGDIWMDISDDGGKKTYIYVDNGAGANPQYDWEEQEVPDEVFDEIDGKAEIFVSKPTTYRERDLWIIESTLADTDLPSGCKKGDIVVADNMPAGISERENNYVKGDWRKKDRYTDDSYAHNFDYLATAMKGDTQVQGGLLLSNTIVLRDLNTSTTPATPTDVMAGLNGIVNTQLQNPQKTIAAWYGGDMQDMEAVSVIDPTVRYAKTLFRMDGTGYMANGKISWDSNGDGFVANGNVRWVTDNQGITTVTINGLTVQSSPSINTQQLLLNGTDVTAKLNALFDMFEKDTTTIPGTTLIKAKYTLYSVGDIQAFSSSSGGGGGGGGGASVLYELNDVWPDSATTPTKVKDAQPGYVLTYGDDNHWYAAPAAQTYVLPRASDTALGGVKTGFTTDATNKNYAVVLDNDGKAYVNVPWVASVQSDWNESDSSSLAYIKNKPSIPSVSASVSGSTLTVTINGTSYSLTDTNTWRPLGTGATDAAAGNHNHDGRYLYWGGSAADANAMGWGTLTTANGYTILSHFASSDGGDGGFAYKSGQISMQVDGKFYQREGAYECIDSGGGQTIADSLKIAEMNFHKVNEINCSYGGGLHLQYSSGYNLTLCVGGGNCGIGDSNPAYKLEVGGNCRIATKLMVATTSTSYELNVGGNIGCNYLYASSDVQVTSDERRKDVIGNVQLSVEQIAQMPSVLFRWKKGFGDDLIHVGTIAQSWEKVLPAAVGIGTDDDRTRSFSYNAAAYAMAHADACEIVALKKRVSELEAELKRYKSA